MRLYIVERKVEYRRQGVLVGFIFCCCFCFCQLDISQGSSGKKKVRLANVLIRLALGKSVSHFLD